MSTPDTWIEQSSWHTVWLAQEHDDGYRLEVGLLRPMSWLGESEVGDATELNLPEMGAEGEFQVMAIERCPEIELGPGRVVTGIFRHSVGTVYDLWLEGRDEPIGVTEQHPFWSQDRLDWIAVSELSIGERLLIRGGTVAVRGFEPRGEEPVFNLQVDADHCYRVGEQGILVHNNSVPLFNTDPKAYKAATEFFENLKKNNNTIECYCAGKLVSLQKRTVPPPNSGWVKPNFTQTGIKVDLPDKQGTWAGTPGDSDFTVNNDPATLQKFGLTGGDNVVPYRLGEPYFDKWAVEWYEVAGLDGSGNDFELIALAVAARHNCMGASGKITATAGKAWMTGHNPPLTPHHAYGCYVALIPTALNTLPHSGTASALRRGVIKC
ncbi:MAG TPA: polymorphic toxin-type HINT domain-containing protein [Urbifossiella sp.]|nr:polymorphic toxin-type HINT domain-containing protein [Urbifossiella sp.]